MLRPENLKILTIGLIIFISCIPNYSLAQEGEELKPIPLKEGESTPVDVICFDKEGYKVLSSKGEKCIACFDSLSQCESTLDEVVGMPQSDWYENKILWGIIGIAIGASIGVGASTF